MNCPEVPRRHAPPRYRRLPAGVAVERAQAPFRGRLLERRCEDDPAACCGEQPRRRQGPPVALGCAGGVPRLLTAHYVFYPPLPAYARSMYGFPLTWGDIGNDAFLAAVEALEIPLVWDGGAEAWAGRTAFSYGRCTAYLKMEMQHIPGGVPGAFTTPEVYDTTGPIDSLGMLFVKRWTSVPEGWFHVRWRFDINGHPDCWPPPLPWQAPTTAAACNPYDPYHPTSGNQRPRMNYYGSILGFTEDFGGTQVVADWRYAPLLNVSCDPFLVEYAFGAFGYVLYNRDGQEIVTFMPPELDDRPHHSALLLERCVHTASLIITEAIL